MAYRKTLVSPRGNEVIARTPADANDLLAQGYRAKADPQPPRKTSRKPRKAAEPAAEAEPATVDTADDGGE